MKTQFDIKHDGTLGTAERTKMTFDENSIAHLMSVLTDLYSNPTLAVVREYSTNAWDAHVAAGNPAPIEVTLPNVMTNQLTIADYGTGMSVKDVTEIFSKYGASTKRDNDEEVGMLGLGCKSGLTYTSQFTFITVQNGIKATVLVTREESGGGVVQIIDTSATDEPNGTEVQIPCKNAYDIAETARDFFQYWDRGTVLIDGVEPKCIWDADSTGTIQVDPDILMLAAPRKYGTKAPSMLVMGNVAYPIDEMKLPLHLQLNIDSMRAVVRVPIGSINFTPSREALHYSKRTLETIEDAWTFIYRSMQRMVQAKVDAATDPKAAWTIWRQWNHVLRSTKQKVMFQGSPFVDMIPVPDKNRTLSMAVRKASWNDADRSTRQSDQIKLSEAYAAVLHVVGFQGTAIAASTKARIRQYCNDKQIFQGEVLVYPKIFGQPWLTNATVNRVRFDVIQAIKLPDDDNRTTTTVRQRSKYRVLMASAYLDYMDALPDTVECWLPAAYTELSRLEIHEFSGGGVVAVVLAADEKRFQRDHPKIPTWKEWAEERIMTIPTCGSDWDNFHWHVDMMRSGYAGRHRLQSVPNFFSYLSKKVVPQILHAELMKCLTEYHDSLVTADGFKRKMYAAQKMNTRIMKDKMPKVPASSVFDQIKKLRAFYDGLLDVSFTYEGSDTFVKGINAYYIVMTRLQINSGF